MLASSERRLFQKKADALQKGRALLEAQSISPSEAAGAGVCIARDGERRDGMALLSFVDVNFDTLTVLRPELDRIDPEVRPQLKRDALYAQYIKRQARDVENLARDEEHAIPRDFDFEALGGLSNELKQKLGAARPETLGQAGRIDGMTPAALTLILAHLQKGQRRQA